MAGLAGGLNLLADPMVYDYPEEPIKPMPHCPVCGEECDRVFMDWLGAIVGCDVCITELDAYNWQEEICER